MVMCDGGAIVAGMGYLKPVKEKMTPAVLGDRTDSIKGKK
jgi:hypothetical protein